jgi:outer membrane protein assembly factor BamB
MREKITIRVREVVPAIRSGMDDASLMKRYGLSAGGLQRLFGKLIARGLLDQYELDARRFLSAETVTLDLTPAGLSLLRDDRPATHSSTERFPDFRWGLAVNGLVTSNIITESGRLYLGTQDGAIYAIDIESGKELWKSSIDDKVTRHLSAKAEILCAVTNRGYLFCLDTETGKENWRFKPEIAANDQTVIHGGLVYVGSLDGILYALDVRTGKEKMALRVGGTIVSSPIVANGMICFGTDLGWIYAFPLLEEPGS